MTIVWEANTIHNTQLQVNGPSGQWSLHHCGHILTFLFSSYQRHFFVQAALSIKVADHESPVILRGGWAAEDVGEVAAAAQPLARDELVAVSGVWHQVADGVISHALARLKQ